MLRSLLITTILGTSAALAQNAPTNSKPTTSLEVAKRYEITSPDGNIRAWVSKKERLSYSVEFVGKTLVAPSRLGLRFSDNLTLGENVQVIGTQTSRHDTKWKNNFGKFSTMRDHYRELRLRLREVRPAPAQAVDFEVILRAYNDGVALRYVLPKQGALGKFTLTEDLTEFLFAEDGRAWAGDNTGFETPYSETHLSQFSDRQKVSLPLVAETGNAYVAVAEADVRDWSGMLLSGTKTAGRGVRSVLISKVESETPRVSPWHALIIARKAGDLTVSTLLPNLATPSKIADTSWIQPGISAWDAWWTGVNPYWDRYKGVEARGNTRSHKDWIDLASEMGWPYMLIDWYWYDQDSHDPETAIKPLEHIDMPELMTYAKAKGVKPLLWVNSNNIRSIGMDKLFATYIKWGVAGVKIDFFANNGSQATQQWYEELIACAAQHKLLIDFHGSYTPTGLARTWPNYITQEGVLGEESTKLGNGFTPSHMIRLPFTRGLLGPADVTPGGFVNVREDQFQPNAVPAQVIGTRARQLALAMLMDSPLLVLCDSPTNYRGQSGLEFYRGLPTTWDDTRVLSSEAMEHLVQARRKGNSWWLAAMNNQNPLALSIKLDFLGRGEYDLHGFSDVPESNEHPTLIKEFTRRVTAKDTIEILMEAAGGFTASFKPVPRQASNLDQKTGRPPS
jgi:alpha-glucosidase